jgi:ABC-type nitrate/sulfonate/bicarbonate transport system substrate-binding protein
MKSICKTLLASVFFVCNLAVSQTVYTAGEQQINTVKDILFPNLVIEKVPGAQGALAWQKVLQNKNSIIVATTSAVHIANLEGGYLPQDPTKETELLATLTRSKQAIFVGTNFPYNKIADIKGKWFVGGIGEKGICSLLMKNLMQNYKIDFTYVPYKLAQQISNDMLGGHIDGHCTTQGGLNVGDQYLRNNTGKIIHTFEKDSFPRLYVFANKELPQDKKQEFIKQITRKFDNQEELLIKNSNINIDINVGEEAVKIFNTERKFWKNLKGEVQ